ncbi:MAG: peptidase M20, partial [Pyramidobacter sp.]|nr:peptidase M20 [Pyramidobacter sp.]
MINTERLVQEFIASVKIDSETRDEGAMTQYAVSKLKELGCEVRTDDAGAKIGSNGSNIYAFYKGTLPGDPLILSAHTDTVQPGRGVEPVVEDGVIKSAG